MTDDDEVFAKTLKSFVEYSVEASEDDVQADIISNVLDPMEKDLTLSASWTADGAFVQPSLTRLTFRLESSEASRMNTLQEAHLQLYGTSGASDLDTRIVITMREGGPKVVWTAEDDDWEENEVWVSPNLKDLLIDAVAHGAETVVTVELTGYGQALRTVASFDLDPCLSPTLAMEFPMPKYY